MGFFCLPLRQKPLRHRSPTFAKSNKSGHFLRLRHLYMFTRRMGVEAEVDLARTINRLSHKKVETLKKPGMHPDGGGLYLQVTEAADGTPRKSWLFRYTVGGRERQMGLGPISDVSLAEARERAVVGRPSARPRRRVQSTSRPQGLQGRGIWPSTISASSENSTCPKPTSPVPGEPVSSSTRSAPSTQRCIGPMSWVSAYLMHRSRSLSAGLPTCRGPPRSSGSSCRGSGRTFFAIA